MNPITRRFFLLASLGICWSLAGLQNSLLCAQVPFPFAPPTTPDAQRNAVNAVRSQVNWLLNSTRTAPGYGQSGAEKVWQEFQTLRGAYGTFKSTLTPAQLNSGANDLAELEAGLDILQEVFSNYEQDLAARRSVASALSNLCQVLARGTRVWLHELNKCSTRLRVGWP
jgi:hypothetical protein